MVQFPLSTVQHQLGFESEPEAARFLRAHGLESEEGTIFLERGTFLLPDTEPPITRAPLLIDSKRTLCYGEVMNGGPLPENPFLSYTPHCSFDEAGVLRKEAYEAADQEAAGPTEEEVRSRREQEEEMESVRIMVRDIVSEVVEEETEEVAEEVVEEVRWQEETSILAMEVAEQVEEEVLEELQDKVAVQALRDARNRLIAIKMEEEQRMEEQEEAAKEVLENLTEELVEEVVEQEMQEVKRRRRLQKYLLEAEPVLASLMLEVVQEQVQETASLALQEAEQEQEQQVELLLARKREKLLRRCFTSWRREATRSARRRQAVVSFPPGPAGLVQVLH